MPPVLALQPLVDRTSTGSRRTRQRSVDAVPSAPSTSCLSYEASTTMTTAALSRQDTQQLHKTVSQYPNEPSQVLQLVNASYRQHVLSMTDQREERHWA